MMCEAENAKRLVMVYIAAASGRVLREIGAARLAPIIGAVIGSRIGDARKLEGLAPLDAGPAPSAMPRAALVAGPGFRKWHAKPRPFADDVGLARVQERRCERDLCKFVERAFLHRRKGLDEGRPAIRVDEMIAAIMAFRFGTTVTRIVSSA